MDKDSVFLRGTSSSRQENEARAREENQRGGKALPSLAINGEFALLERDDQSTAEWRNLKLERRTPKKVPKKKLVASLEW
jgi:hypothetical protein